jgi:predicted ATPase
LWPVIQQLTVALKLAAEDSPATRLDKIEGFFRRHATHIESAVPLVASLLGVPYDNRYGPLDLSPQAQRNQTLSVLVEQFLGLARRRPVLVVVEDMHWTDPSTLEFIHLVLDRVEGNRLLLLLTSRPDGQPVLAGHPQVTRVVLNRLGRAAVEAMTAAIEGSASLPEAVRREILSRTDGVPLFVEELTRALVELAGQCPGGMMGSETSLSVPATLHDSLMARLDRLPEVKRVAQVAACIGRNFDYRTLAAVAGMDDRELNPALDRLVEAELVFRRGRSPNFAYTFNMRWCAMPRPQPAAQRVSPHQCRHRRGVRGLRGPAAAGTDRLARRTCRPRSHEREGIHLVEDHDAAVTMAIVAQQGSRLDDRLDIFGG